MFFPIWDDQVHNWHTPYITWIFLVANIAIFVYQASLSPIWFQEFVVTYGSIPSEILSWTDTYTLLTNMFLHGSRAHLIWNMVYLYVFWDNIESSIGSVRFLTFYLLGWIVASLAHILFNVWSTIPAVWASWAIAAILGAYLVMFPGSRIRTLSLYGMRTVLISANWFLILRIGLQLFSWVGAQVAANGWGGTAWRAHIGWFAFWWIAGFRFKDVWNRNLHRK